MDKKKFLIVIVSFALPILAFADQISLIANDPAGATSFNTAGQWSNGTPPALTNDYFTSTFYIRTPGDTADPAPFTGNSLTLQSGSSSGGTPYFSFIFKGGGYRTYTINNFTNDSGGLLRSGSGSLDTCVIAGNLMAISGNSTIDADQSPFVIASPLVGSAVLTNLNPAPQTYGTVTYSGTNSAFTGEFFLGNNAIVIFENPGSVPGNPSSPNPGQFTLSPGSTLQDNAGVTLSNGNGGITLLGNAALNASATNSLGADISMVVTVPITDNGSNYILTKSGAGIVTLSGDNTFGGGLTLLVGTAGSQLNINSPTAVGTGPFLLAFGGVAPAILDNNSGSAITLANNNPLILSNSLAFVGSSSLNMGSGTVTLGTNVTVAVSNNNLTVGPISDGGIGYSLTKSGAGTLTINEAASFTGETIINDGILALTGSGSLSSSNISLTSDTATLDVSGIGGLTLVSGQTFGGSGNLSGALTTGGGALVTPGGDNIAGTLTVNGDLTLNSGGDLNFDLAASTTPGGGTNDLIIVTGALDITGPTALNISGTPVNGDYYTLIQYGTFAGNVANLSAPGYVITNDASAHAIQIIKVHVPTSLMWQGDGTANIWDAGATANWLQSGTNQYFFTGDLVTFDDSGSASPPINLSGFISPGATVVSASKNYDFIGSGILSGSLTKAGVGTLILENNNSYSEGTTINGGVLQVGNASTSGTLGGGDVTNEASLVFDRSDAITVTNDISGTGTVTHLGAGDLYLSGSNSYSGQTTIASAGVLHPRSGDALGAGDFINTGGGKLYVDANINLLNPMTLGGGTALEKGGGGVSVLGGAITLASDTTLSIDGGATLNLTNALGLNGSAANANLTLAGSGAGGVSGPLTLGTGNLIVSGGTWTVAPTNSYSGLTMINAGALLITGPLSLSQPPVSFNASQVTLGGGALGAAADVTLNDGTIGIFVNDLSSASGIMVGSNATFTVTDDIGGDASAFLTKTGPGTLILNGTNDFAGTLNLDSGSTSANDGRTVIANNAAIANILAVPSAPFINIRDNNSGSSTLALDGTQGGITIAPDIALAGRNVAVPAIESIAGENTISGNFTLNVGGSYYIQSDSGTLTLSAPLPLATPGGARAFNFSGGGEVIASGGIQDASGGVVSVVENGSGVLSLPAANTYSGATTVNGGVLQVDGSIGGGTNNVSVAGGLLTGNGSIGVPVNVLAGGSIEAGDTNAIGTLTLSGALVLSGDTMVKINKTTATSDLFSGQSSVTYGGTLTVTNLAGTPALGDSFTLFSPGTSSGNFANIAGVPGPNLHYSFTNGVLSVAAGSAIAGNPTNILFSVSGNTLNLSWPADHLGWILQAQTNSISAGLSANWVDVPQSQGVTSTNLTINPANPTVFYRLRHP